ncbi:MAG: hypothetical protein V4555_14285 [Acidobacteriota bacterium]
MLRTYVLRALVIAGVVVACSKGAHAQCSADINAAFAANHSTASAAECDRSRYGGGSWSGPGDLVVRVAKARLCPDPWIGQIYWNLYNRNPTAAECSVNYGGRTSYMNYASAIQAYHNAPAAAAAPSPTFYVDANRNLVDASHRVIAAAGTFDLRDANGNPVTLVAAGGGNLVAAGGGNLVAAGGGNLVAAGGGNMTGQRSVMSAGSKKVFIVRH